MCDLDISEKAQAAKRQTQFQKIRTARLQLRVATSQSSGGVEDMVTRLLAACEPIPIEKLRLTVGNTKRPEETVSETGQKRCVTATRRTLQSLSSSKASSGICAGTSDNRRLQA